MIFEPPHQNRASYDDDGNIILPPEGGDGHVLRENTWNTIEDDSAQNEESPIAPNSHSRLTRRRGEDTLNIWQSTRTKIYEATQNFFQEGAHQYRTSYSSGKKSARASLSSLRFGIGGLWAFLTQPVWIVHRRRNTTKQYSRLSLFLLDTVRFGGTFAALFVFLFATLNYQSFWKIGNSYLNPISRIQSEQALSNPIENTLKEKLLRSPSLATAGGTNGELLSFLPTVGPPENRIIIPKLGLNIPLVTPSYEALLAEDWEGLEGNIQEALKLGVVHYPGTARPGQTGNFFVTGHSSYYPWSPGKYKTVFARLHELDINDEYWVFYGGDKYRYIVRSKKEVKPTNVNVLDQPINKRTATLMTCTPVGTTLRRLIISAEEIDPVTGASLSIGQQHVKVMPKLNLQALPI